MMRLCWRLLGLGAFSYASGADPSCTDFKELKTLDLPHATAAPLTSARGGAFAIAAKEQSSTDVHYLNDNKWNTWKLKSGPLGTMYIHNSTLLVLGESSSTAKVYALALDKVSNNEVKVLLDAVKLDAVYTPVKFIAGSGNFIFVGTGVTNATPSTSVGGLLTSSNGGNTFSDAGGRIADYTAKQYDVTSLTAPAPYPSTKIQTVSVLVRKGAGNPVCVNSFDNGFHFAPSSSSPDKDSTFVTAFPKNSYAVGPDHSGIEFSADNWYTKKNLRPGRELPDAPTKFNEVVGAGDYAFAFSSVAPPGISYSLDAAAATWKSMTVDAKTVAVDYDASTDQLYAVVKDSTKDKYKVLRSQCTRQFPTTPSTPMPHGAAHNRMGLFVAILVSAVLCLLT